MANFEDISDEDLANMTPEQFAEKAGATKANSEGDEESTESKDETVTNAADPVVEPEKKNEEGTPNDSAEAASNTENEPSGNTAEATAKTVAEAPTKPEKVEEPKPAENTAVDYEAEYKKILAPFKANGREIQVNSVDEAVQLMQMGASYSKKMAGLKPKLATLRMLENNKITDETLGFLIDVHNKVPEAINKLVKDSGIDPMDLSAEKADGYKPGNHKPAPAEVELDVVLEDLKDSPSFVKTMEVVTEVWDAPSRQLIAQNPQVLKAINSQIESGIYDLITTEVERERTFGRLNGLSDLQAYRQVGDAMNASGKFAQLGNTAGQPNSSQSQQAPAVSVVVTPNPQKADDSKRNEQRRAAAPAKGTVNTTAAKSSINPLSLSDEEFAKFKP